MDRCYLWDFLEDSEGTNLGSVFMRLVVQRVKEARVSSNGEVVGEIGRGLFVLVGVARFDKTEYADVLANKLIKLRVMADEEGKMNLSIKDPPVGEASVNSEILVVSQFTLYADTSGGNRPSFIQAADPKLAEEIYNTFVQSIKQQGVKVATGSFGNYMEIETVLDGPVTIILEYPQEDGNC